MNMRNKIEGKRSNESDVCRISRKNDGGIRAKASDYIDIAIYSILYKKMRYDGILYTCCTLNLALGTSKRAK